MGQTHPAKIKFILAVMPAFIGSLALVGWALDFEVLKHGISSSVSMNPATALGFILLGLETLRLHVANDRLLIRRVGQFAIWLVLVASTLKFSDFLLGTSFAIDQQLFASKLDLEPLHPNRMAPKTAFSFLMLSMALQAMRSGSRKTVLVAQALISITMLLAILALVGYLYGVKSLAGFGVYIPMAFNTAFAFICLSIAILYIRPSIGIMKPITREGNTRAVAAILIPTGLIFPIIWGWLAVILVHHAPGEAELPHAISVVLNVLTFFALSYVSLRLLHSSDSRRQKAEDDLRDSESRLRAIIQNEPECIKVVDAQGRLLEMNPAGLAMIEADRFEQIAGNPILDVIAPEHRKAFADMHKRVIGGESMTLEFEVIGLKGGHRWLDTHAVPMREADGSVVHLAVTRDLSVRRRNEQLLRTLSTAVEQSPTQILISDHKSNIEYVNEAFTKITGYSREEVIGRNPRLLQSGKTPRATYEDMWTTLNRGENWRGELFNKRKDGSIYVADALFSTVRDEHGNLTNYLAIQEDITERKHLEDELKRQAHIDFLTGLSSRGHFMEQAELELNRAVRYDNPLSLFMIDIDYFKQINDNHGHKAGDAVLVKLGEVCREALREVDIIGRVGGEEFAILLPETDKDEATEVAERLRDALANAKVLLQAGGLPLHFTVSIGLASLSSKDDNLDVLFNLADKALYEAKNSGRNRVCVVAV